MNLRPKSFRAKLLLLFVPVIALAQLATSYIVSRFNDSQAHQLIAEDLQKAALTFQRVVEDRNSLLVTNARTAARDHQIKQLLAGDDRDTLASALESVRGTTGSDLVTAVSPEARLFASTSRAVPSAGLHEQLIALAEADPNPNPTATGYGYFDGKLHSVVIVPMKAGSEIIAWLVIGFHIDREFVHGLKKLTNIDLTFFNPAGQALASTLPEATVAKLVAGFPRLRTTPAGSRQLPLGSGTALVDLRRLATGDREVATLALQYSLDEKLKPADEAERFLRRVAFGSLLIAVLLALAFARHLSRPIVELVGRTRRIAQGDYSVRYTSYRQDELGRLSESFDHMARGLEERDRVRDLLDKNVSPEVAAQLLRDGATLGGEEREVTILFADLRGFTTLSEKYAPRELLTLLNRYLDRMSNAIEAQGGIIDKYIGDAIMALFGAPIAQDAAADRALAAALAMERALTALNAELAAESIAPLAIGIGINTARVVAGNIGSHRRLNYSVIGDGVNVAARLQAETRKPDFRTNLITSAATLAAVRDRTKFTARPLGSVQVKGRAESVEIFAIGA